MAPEYANRGVFSMKSDMFSFGVLILEIISGRKNYDLQFDEEQRQLLNFVSKSITELLSTILMDWWQWLFHLYMNLVSKNHTLKLCIMMWPSL